MARLTPQRRLSFYACCGETVNHAADCATALDGPRFWRRVVVAANGCWEWTGYVRRDGYGSFGRPGARPTHRRDWIVIPVHRFSYLYCYGSIPAGLTIDHLCRNKRCVHPLHLEPVTAAENVRRQVPWNSLKTHCKHGHEFTPKNTYVLPSRPNARYCRACQSARYYAKKAAA